MRSNTSTGLKTRLLRNMCGQMLDGGTPRAHDGAPVSPQKGGWDVWGERLARFTPKGGSGVKSRRPTGASSLEPVRLEPASLSHGEEMRMIILCDHNHLYK